MRDSFESLVMLVAAYAGVGTARCVSVFSHNVLLVAT